MGLTENIHLDRVPDMFDSISVSSIVYLLYIHLIGEPFLTLVSTHLGSERHI